jgi:hypothetical protein
MEWLRNPWVIGIGSAVIAGLILYYAFGIGKAKPRRQMSSGLPAGEETPISKLPPKEITGYLHSVPPLQKEAAAKNYEGIRVSWEVNLEAAHPAYDGKLHLMMLDKEKYPWVCCDVDPSNYPELRIMKKERLFRTEGEIKSANEAIIELINCQLRF